MLENDQEHGRDELLGRVQSLVRAFGVLDVLAKSDGMVLSEIARQVKLPRSTVHRLLTTMEALHHVEFNSQNNQWSIGVQAFAVGAAFAQTRDLGQLGRTIMRSLMNEVHHSVNIAVPGGGGMCYVGQVAAQGIKQKTIRPGACLPMHTTAVGKAMMAHWAPNELDAFLERKSLSRRTASSIVQPQALCDELDVIRERGYAFDWEEHEEGLRCVAAIVHDQYGTPKASLSISDAASRLNRDRMEAMGPTLVLAARQMSNDIGTQLE